MSTMREVQQNWTEITRRLLERQEYLKFLPFSANLYGLPFSNAALVYHQNPECKRAATAAQWNSIHFVVKRGEHGITVFDETNRNNALSFLFDESQMASSQKTVMPQRMDFSAYEEQLCQAFGQRQGKAYSNLQALCAGMVQHFMSDPKATLLLQENERTMGLHDTQKQQYEESVASVCCYVAMLRCFPEKEIQQPDLSAFDFFRNDIANLIRFGNIVQKIYGNVLNTLKENVKLIKETTREVEINDTQRVNGLQNDSEELQTGRTRQYAGVQGRIDGDRNKIHDAMGHDTSRSAQSDGEKHRRTLGQDLAAVDAAESSQSMAAADTGERLPAGNPDDRNRPDRRGDVSEENAAIPTGESSAGQETEPESLSGVGQESDSGSSAASVGRDRVSDAADTVTTTEKESQAEAENPSVSAFSVSKSDQFPLISDTLPFLAEQSSDFTKEIYQTEKASVLKIKNKGSIATIEITADSAIWQRLAEKGLVKQENSADRLVFDTDGRNWNKLIIPDKWGNKTNNISIDEILTHEELLIAYHVADEILNEDDMQQPDLLKSADTTAESDRFQLYQLKDGEEYHGIRFESLDQNKLHSNQLNKEDYVLVYEGDLSIYSGDTVEEKLERLYQEFNVNKPVDFMGRSMSVSDVVVIDENAYYCDPIRFREFPEFLREKEVEPPAVADFRAKTEEETLFSKVNLAKFLAEHSLSSDEWEDMAYPMFERGYLDTHKPSDKAVFGYHLSESAFFALAQRYHDGEDIRRELAVRLLEGGTSSDIAFVFEGENISSRTYFYAENLRHSLHAERTKNGYQCSFGSTERFVSFEEIGQAFLDRTLEEFNDLMYWRVLDYIKDDIPDISNDTVRELINAFDNAATADWEKGDNLPKLNRIKKALYDILGDEEQTEKAFACIAKQKYNVTFDKPAAKESPVHFGLLGNGITAYDTSRTDPETHDYPIVAQISDEGVVRVYDENISAEDMERINSEAKLAREKFMTNWNMLSPEQQFQRLLDRADISTAINIGREQFSMAQKIEKYMPFVFFGEGERPEPEKKQPAKVSDLAVGDIILYDGNRREVENISEHSTSLKNLDAPDFGGILLSTSDVLAYNGWQQDMESKGFEILSKAEQHSQDTNDILSALSDLDKAKNYINDFSVDEYSSEADFSDLSNVPIAYTTDEKTDLEIQVSADLEKYRLVYAYDGNVVREEQYHSLSEMNANALSVLDYDDLVSLSDDEKAKISAVNTRIHPPHCLFRSPITVFLDRKTRKVPKPAGKLCSSKRCHRKPTGTDVRTPGISSSLRQSPYSQQKCVSGQTATCDGYTGSCHTKADHGAESDRTAA